ncbi:hypothetical protein [Streptosporangium saharense]|uniref:Translation initiation factor IF-2 n=1 Tax=Streptosporangium saharense TaxID=1706840 RepID=A0A7W7VPS5_9ACTN|nr:hypothetical protein [Streptosporangium saharense]MBB4917983.1 hypothetical protein [Streptosporangium saharense]
MSPESIASVTSSTLGRFLAGAALVVPAFMACGGPAEAAVPTGHTVAVDPVPAVTPSPGATKTRRPTKRDRAVQQDRTDRETTGGRSGGKVGGRGGGKEGGASGPNGGNTYDPEASADDAAPGGRSAGVGPGASNSRNGIKRSAGKWQRFK